MRILDVDEARPGEAPLLTSHISAAETVLAIYVSPTGAVLFTDGRILIVQREFLLEEKIETISYPYRTVRHFSIQEGEGGKGRSAVRIWLGDEPQPLHLRANSGTDLGALQLLMVDRLR